jgi:hypothetical protein
MADIQHKRTTAAQWTILNPVLADGEMGIETDTRQFKFGNGVTAWSGLNYGGSSAGGNVDGGVSDSIYGGIPIIDGGGI